MLSIAAIQKPVHCFRWRHARTRHSTKYQIPSLLHFQVKPARQWLSWAGLYLERFVVEFKVCLVLFCSYNSLYVSPVIQDFKKSNKHHVLSHWILLIPQTTLQRASLDSPSYRYAWERVLLDIISSSKMYLDWYINRLPCLWFCLRHAYAHTNRSI